MQFVIQGQNFTAILFLDLVDYYIENCVPPPIPPASQEDCCSPWDCDRDNLYGREQICAIQFNSMNSLKSNIRYQVGFKRNEANVIINAAYMHNGQFTTLTPGGLSGNINYWSSGSFWSGRSTKKVIINRNLFIWSFGKNGDQMRYILHNRARYNSGSTTFNTSVTNGNLNTVVTGTIDMKENDRLIGEKIVYYCDPSPIGGRAYSIGGDLTIWVRTLPNP